MSVKFSVSSKRCSPPKVFRAFLTHFWRNFGTHFWRILERSSFPTKTRPILTHFWRISDIADAFSENTFWTIPKFLSAILGPEMGASILWTPGKMRSFCRKNLHVHKIPRFRFFLGGFGGGKCRFYFYGRGDFSESLRDNLARKKLP